MRNMLPFFRRNRSRPDRTDPTLPDVSQPMPLDGGHVDPADGLSVSELSELEARALCAREDIPVFWPRPGEGKRRA